MMNIRTLFIIIIALFFVCVSAGIAVATSADDNGSPSSWSSDNSQMQEEGDENPDGDDTEGDDTEGDEAEGDEEESSEEEISEEEPVEEETPSADEVAGMSDVLADQAAGAGVDTNLEDALAGIKDYEVTYITSISHAENTPPELDALGVEYAGEDSPVARRTQAIEALDLLATLANRYQIVEDEFAADPDEDLLPEDPDRFLNYFEPRFDPFVITDLIPEELRPEMEGTGLDGAVDPDLLEELYWANYTALLRTIPIRIVGVIEAGPNRGCLYILAGWPQSVWIEEGQTQNLGSFSVHCAQVSEDFVVFILMAGSSSVTRTFHVSK